MINRIVLSAVLIVTLLVATSPSQARWMNPQTGRFHTMDTYEGDQETPQSLHRYVYCYGDPVNRTDPSGHLVEDPLFAGFLNVNMTQRDAARVSAGRAMAMKSIAMTTAVMAIIAIETLPLGEMQPQPDPIPAPPGMDPKQWNPNLLFRGMMEEGGMPKIGDSRRTLGVVEGTPPKGDIQVGAGNTVAPGTGGMSVALGTPMNLPEWRRPRILGGSGKDPVWGIHASLLGPSLMLRKDSPTHGVVEPIMPMSLDSYRNALGSTRETWLKVVNGN